MSGGQFIGMIGVSGRRLGDADKLDLTARVEYLAEVLSGKPSEGNPYAHLDEEGARVELDRAWGRDKRPR